MKTIIAFLAGLVPMFLGVTLTAVLTEPASIWYNWGLLLTGWMSCLIYIKTEDYLKK